MSIKGFLLFVLYISLYFLVAMISGCSNHAYTDAQRIEDANEYCGWRGYQHLKIYRAYGEIEAIYCSLDQDVGQPPEFNPLPDQDVPHE